MSSPRKTNSRTLVIFLLIALFLIAQFIRPTITHPPVTGDLQAPPEVKAILVRACYDCHSNETRLRWYDQIVPVYWGVADHVREGRAVLNFSHWDSLATGDQNAKLWESVNLSIFGSMPPENYTWVHSSVKVTADELTVLKNYLLNKPVVQPTDSTKQALLENQKHMIATQDTLTGIPVASNGISFIPDYKNWQMVSTTERYDNGTLRMILGNETAINAIREKNTKPWPTGTTFAKVAWNAIKDSAGNLRTGPFIQVEFMIKDELKYASTKGWGFARFKTPKMVPYGKNALFVSECVNCHQPMKDFDYVYTTPVAGMPDVLQTSGSDYQVLGPFINTQNGTASVFFENKKTKQTNRVSWKQKEDEHWFGAKIPDGQPATDTVSQNETAALRSLFP